MQTKLKLTPVAVFPEVYVKRAGDDTWCVEQALSWAHDPGNGELRRFEAAAAIVPDEAGWAELCRVANTAVPNVMIAIGATLVGNYPHGDIGGEYIEGAILVGLQRRLPGPMGLLHHEIMHAVWNRLDEGSREIIEKHGASLRCKNRENAATKGFLRLVHPVEWFDSPQEAEAVSFQEWAIGNSVCLDIEHPSEVTEIWENIRAGQFGYRASEARYPLSNLDCGPYSTQARSTCNTPCKSSQTFVQYITIAHRLESNAIDLS